MAHPSQHSNNGLNGTKVAEGGEQFQASRSITGHERSFHPPCCDLEVRPTEASGKPWVEFERDLLFDIIEEHLLDDRVGGSWSKINWDKVADTYNCLMVGIQQKTGDRIAEIMIRINDKKDGTEKSIIKFAGDHRLTENCASPYRPVAEIRNWIEAFPDQRIVEVIHRAQDEDGEVHAKSRWRGEVPKKRSMKANLPAGVNDCEDFELEDESTDENQRSDLSDNEFSSSPVDELIFEDAERIAVQQAYA